MSGYADTIRAGILAPDREANGQIVPDALDALAEIEADLALSRNLYDELFAQTEQLRSEIRLLRETVRHALEEIRAARDSLGYLELYAKHAYRIACNALDGTSAAE